MPRLAGGTRAPSPTISPGAAASPMISSGTPTCNRRQLAGTAGGIDPGGCARRVFPPSRRSARPPAGWLTDPAAAGPARDDSEPRTGHLGQVTRREIMMRLRARLAIAAAVAGAATASTLVAATPAQAWVWDSHVRISGFAKCYNGPFALPSAAAQITIRLRPTGETRTVSVNGFGYYGADFYTVPVAGGWA